MYRIEDTVSAIKELQRLLGLSQTGNYDDTTKGAVVSIQKKYALPINGVTDYSTFKVIVDEYKNRNTNVWESNYLFAPKFPFIKGDMGDNAGRINEALSTVLRNYRYEESLPRGKYVGSDTILAIRFLRKIFGMDKSDEIDERFMNRLILELDGIEIKEKYR